MKRLITILSAVSIALISCQQNLVPDEQEITASADEVMTRTYSTGKVIPDDPVIFLPATNMKAWTDIESLEDRFEACKVSETRLSNMTTEALVKSMMNYPLNYLVFVYNDPKMAIDIIVNNSTLHKEYISRPDAAEVIVDMYSEVVVDMRPEKSDFDGDYRNLSYTNTMFIEHFLGSHVFTVLGKASVKQKLTEIVEINLNERLQNTEKFSMYSIEPLLEIDKTQALGVIDSGRYVYSPFVLLGYDKVYTVFGKEVETSIYAQMNTTDMENIINDVVTNHPNAIIRGAATRDYNCHSYAWYSQDLNNTHWIKKQTHDGVYQLSKYWTSDLYESCLESEAEKIHYSDGDHSAIKLSNGNYLSKWGQGPLVEHAPMDCPYLKTNINYYRIRTTPLPGSITITGTTPVVTNQSYNYSINERYSSLTYSWEVRFMDAPTPTPFILNVNSTGRGCSLICQDYGLFKMIVNGYYQGRKVASGQLNVISMPNL